MEDQQRPCRAYKRFPAEVWNKHKGTVRQLFMDQDKTYKEVGAILSDRYGLTVGERQLKRKTEEWGFYKNIPSKEMDQMIRTRRHRRENLGRPTEFRRKQGDGEFHQISNSKLALHERRMESDPGSPSLSSPCSSLPSNIECYTPSDFAESPPGTVETIPTTPTTWIYTPKPPLPSAQRVQVAAQLALDGKYSEAACNFRQLGRITSSPWGAVLYDFNAEIMDVAGHGGCPETLATRVSNALFCYLFREREKHRNTSLFSVTTARDPEALSKVSSGLQMNAKFWGSVVVQHRLLQLLGPILGNEHPKMGTLRDSLATKRSATIVNMDAGPDLVLPRNILEVIDELDTGFSLIETTLEGETDLFSLDKGPPGQVGVKIEAIENLGVDAPIHGRGMLRFGRSRALLGVFYSFNERYVDAQMAFHDSAETICYETCVEVKLNRMLWDAEHRTRIWDWDGAWELLCQSRRFFLEAEKSPAFLEGNFIRRFSVLSSAIQQRMPVDRLHALDLDGLGDQADALGVDIEAWRHFVD